MSSKDIKTLIKILNYQGKIDLAILLDGCSSAINESGNWGSFQNSTLASFSIFAPLVSYYRLKELSKVDIDALYHAVLDIYPHQNDSVEITNLEFRLLDDDKVTEERTEENISYVGKTIRAFISYSTVDKLLVGHTKLWLEKYGISVFIAHEDINPSLEWQEVILQELDSTDVFIPLITQDFEASKWTDQESGIAFTKGKLIIPVSINGHTPYGFLNRFQALKFNSKRIDLSCRDIVMAISKNKRFSDVLLDSIIQSLPKTNSFDEAGCKFDILAEYKLFTSAQINDVIKNAHENSQIHQSRTARSSIEGLIKRFSKMIDLEHLAALNSQWGKD